MFQNKALNYLKGMHHHGIMGAAKHFPGHGDTETDSHLTLPTLVFQKIELMRLNYILLKVNRNGLDGIMTAHLNIPSLDKEYYIIKKVIGITY